MQSFLDYINNIIYIQNKFLLKKISKELRIDYNQLSKKYLKKQH
jgi:hypothetical protein